MMKDAVQVSEFKNILCKDFFEPFPAVVPYSISLRRFGSFHFGAKLRHGQESELGRYSRCLTQGQKTDSYHTKMKY